MSAIGPRVARWPLVASGTLLAASVLLLVATARSASRRAADAVPALPAGEPGTTVAAVASRVPTAREVAAAVDADPFNPERQRPDVPYLLADAQEEAADPAPAVPTSDVPSVRLVGTVVGDGGGFAVCDDGSGVPRVVRIGERIGSLTLRGVAAGVARFSGPDGATVELTVPKPGAR